MRLSFIIVYICIAWCRLGYDLFGIMILLLVLFLSI